MLVVSLCGLASAQRAIGVESSPRAPTSIDFGRYHALVIGNQRYRSLPTLKTPAADAQAVADVLRREYRFTRVELLIDASRSQMVSALTEMRRTLGPNDNLLIYYAGHGYLDTEADRGYWLAIDAERDNPANWVSNADITDALRAMRAKHVLVVVDSCYSGTLTRDVSIRPPEGTDVSRLAQKRARNVLASGGLEPVSDVGGGGYSVFARAFLQALRSNAGVADAMSLSAALRREVLLRAEQTPQYGDIRMAGHEGGDFLFVRGLRPTTAASSREPLRLEGREVIRQEVGSLLLSSRLAGVDVWIGDQKVWTSRMGAGYELSNVPVGAHQIVARKQGHKDWARIIEVSPNKRAEIIIDIEPLQSARQESGRISSLTAQDIYQAAYLDFSKSSYWLAVAGFREFLRRFPEHDLAGNAQYWIGEAHHSLARGYGNQGQADKAREALEQAVVEFRRVVANYPRGEKVPASLFKEALALIDLKQPALAQARLQYLIDNFPQAQETQLAHHRLSTLKSR